MAEQTQRLREAVAQLQERLAAGEALEDEERRELESVAEEIRGLSDPRADSGGPSPTERLRVAVRRFESSHPELAHALGRVIDALSELGI